MAYAARLVWHTFDDNREVGWPSTAQLQKQALIKAHYNSLPQVLIPFLMLNAAAVTAQWLRL